MMCQKCASRIITQVDVESVRTEDDESFKFFFICFMRELTFNRICEVI